MFCCHNRRICIQTLCLHNLRNVDEMFLLSQSQEMHTKCFAGIIAGYVYKMFCFHNRRIRIQNVLLSLSQDMYTKSFCWHIRRFNIDNPYFEQMVGQIYPTELQLNKANSSDTEAPFLDLNLSITNGIVSSKIYDKRDDFNFEIVNFPFLDGDVPRSLSYGVYISQLIRFARVCSNVDDFNNRNLFLTAKLLKQGYRYHKIRKAFSKFYYRHCRVNC